MAEFMDDPVAIVETITTLAKTLRLSVTGEGIETDLQYLHLRSLGCDRGQGYYFARPMPAGDVTSALQADQSRPDCPVGSLILDAAITPQ